MHDYFKRLFYHPGFGLSIILGLGQVFALSLNKSVCIEDNLILIPILFVFPWLFIVLLTNIKKG